MAIWMERASLFEVKIYKWSSFSIFLLTFFGTSEGWPLSAGRKPIPFQVSAADTVWAKQASLEIPSIFHNSGHDNSKFQVRCVTGKLHFSTQTVSPLRSVRLHLLSDVKEAEKHLQWRIIWFLQHYSFLNPATFLVPVLSSIHLCPFSYIYFRNSEERCDKQFEFTLLSTCKAEVERSWTVKTTSIGACLACVRRMCRHIVGESYEQRLFYFFFLGKGKQVGGLYIWSKASSSLSVMVRLAEKGRLSYKWLPCQDWREAVSKFRQAYGNQDGWR